MPSAGRLGDSAAGHGCFPATPIISGSPDVSINGKPAARKGDPVLLHACPCPKMPHGIHGRSISAGSSNVSINGKPASRVGDAIGCGGQVAAGSGDVFIGETPYQSPSHDCGEGAAKSNAPFLRILPLVNPVEALWSKPIYSPGYFKSVAEQQLKGSITQALPEELPPLGQDLSSLVKSGGSPEQMLYVLEKGTTKAKRRKAREAITKRASEKEPDVAERFTQDMDAAEKAMLSEHIYTLDKEKLKEPRQQVAEDFKHDSGWTLASDDDLNDLGLSRKDLRVKGSNFRAQVYMPDHKVFGSEAKPVLVFRGTEAVGDWTKGNIPQGLMGRSKYYKQAVEISRNIKKAGSPIEISGHSLGGGLASAASKAGNYPATTFNSAGLHKKTVERYGVPKAQQGSDDNITRYRIEGEVLTHAQEKMPVLRRLPSAVGNTTQTFSKPKSLTAQTEGVGAAIGTNVAIADDTDVTLKERVNLHGMDMMREAIEDRKVDDLHTLAKQV
ncbi:phospholipase [Salinivibrio sp. MA427]|uniref:PAAR domain-containing protein n=1 Tax=Salinivibrio sp. MA427 TaxID=1909455 RepID=UPI00098A4D67|nr:PAAR domain-containing protein [Salinivibrio sp. MA427]OOF08741.1 phospholipase [Salinivibrio sp. MA427]